MTTLHRKKSTWTREGASAEQSGPQVHPSSAAGNSGSQLHSSAVGTANGVAKTRNSLKWVRSDAQPAASAVQGTAPVPVVAPPQLPLGAASHARTAGGQGRGAPTQPNSLKWVRPGTEVTGPGSHVQAATVPLPSGSKPQAAQPRPQTVAAPNLRSQHLAASAPPAARRARVWQRQTSDQTTHGTPPVAPLAPSTSAMQPKPALRAPAAAPQHTSACAAPLHPIAPQSSAQLPGQPPLHRTGTAPSADAAGGTFGLRKSSYHRTAKHKLQRVPSGGAGAAGGEGAGAEAGVGSGAAAGVVGGPGGKRNAPGALDPPWPAKRPKTLTLDTNPTAAVAGATGAAITANGKPLRYKTVSRSKLVLAPTTPRTPRTPGTLRGSKVVQWVRATEGGAAAALTSSAARRTSVASQQAATARTAQAGPQRPAQAGATTQRQSKQLVLLGGTHYLVVRGRGGKRQLRAMSGATTGPTAALGQTAATHAVRRSKGSRTWVRTGANVTPSAARTPTRTPLRTATTWTSSLAAKRIQNSLQLARSRSTRSAAAGAGGGSAAGRVRKYQAPCSDFCRTGQCKGQRDGSCRLDHDPNKVAVCAHWLQGTCNRPNCKLQHKRNKDLMPVCSFFLQGLCSAEDCPYLHIRYPPNTPLCRAFRFGYCPLGQQCNKRHERVAGNKAKAGTMRAGARAEATAGRGGGSRGGSATGRSGGRVGTRVRDS